jgi:hypothetical protein
VFGIHGKKKVMTKVLGKFGEHWCRCTSPARDKTFSVHVSIIMTVKYTSKLNTHLRVPVSVPNNNDDETDKKTQRRQRRQRGNVKLICCIPLGSTIVYWKVNATKDREPKGKQHSDISECIGMNQLTIHTLLNSNLEEIGRW